MKLSMLIICLFSIISCSKMREREIHIIPKELIGSQIRINFNSEEGQPKKYENSKRVYEIPASGILNTRFETNNGWYEKSAIEFYLKNADGIELMPYKYAADTTDFFKDFNGQIGVMGFYLTKGSFSYVVDTIDYELFLRKNLYYREDIEGKRKAQKDK